MTSLVLGPRLRNVLAMAAVLLSAVASIATSDCTHTEETPVSLKDALLQGQTSKRFHIYAPNADSVNLNVDSGLTLSGTASRNGDEFSLASGGGSLNVQCKDSNCYDSCPSICDDILVEVSRPDPADASERITFTLAGGSWNSYGCSTEDVLVEVKIEPE